MQPERTWLQIAEPVQAPGSVQMVCIECAPSKHRGCSTAENERNLVPEWNPLLGTPIWKTLRFLSFELSAGLRVKRVQDRFLYKESVWRCRVILLSVYLDVWPRPLFANVWSQMEDIYSAICSQKQKVQDHDVLIGFKYNALLATNVMFHSILPVNFDVMPIWVSARFFHPVLIFSACISFLRSCLDFLPVLLFVCITREFSLRFLTNSVCQAK